MGYRGKLAERQRGAAAAQQRAPRVLLRWLRRFFEIDPPAEFQKPYRAVPDPTIRHAKHVHGCVSIDYSCSPTHRSIMGLVAGLLADDVTPG
jgi:hypothetical protein